jgi:DHA1 family solute carrier family 18 vesicular amine transporter 1/2
MFVGFVIMFFSTISELLHTYNMNEQSYLVFALGSTYFTLWLARSLQGIGSACTSTSGNHNINYLCD